jgi:lambda repressor-like predicted transcriptional regulator
MNARTAPSSYAQAVAAEVAARYGARVSADVVQIVPQGMMSAPMPFWCPKAKQLRYPDGSDFYRKTVADGTAGRMPERGVALRRKKVAALHAQGFCDREVALALEVSYQVATNDRYALKLPRIADQEPAQILAARNSQIRALRAEGWTFDQLQAKFGLQRKTLGTIVANVVPPETCRQAEWNATKALRESGFAKRQRTPLKAKKQPRVPRQPKAVVPQGENQRDKAKARRADLVAYLDGLCRPVTFDELVAWREARGVTQITLRVDMHKLGRDLPPFAGEAMARAVQARLQASKANLAEVERMQSLLRRARSLRAEGASFRAIAADLGVSISMAHRYLTCQTYQEVT